jgi:hypothetical protein
METAKKRRIRQIVLWSASAALALNLVTLAPRPWRVRAASGQPYTVVRTESGFDKAGVLKYTNRYIEAQRSDASTLRQAVTSVENRRRIYFANGDQVLTNELLGRKSTYPKRYSEVPGQRNPQASCYTAADAKTGWVIDGEETIAGHQAVRLRLSGSNRTMVAWHALDVGCALLQLRFEHESGVTVQNLVSLTAGEPDPALFQVPASYQEAPPSSLYEPVCRDGRCTSVPDSLQQRLDRNYYAVRARSQ